MVAIAIGLSVGVLAGAAGNHNLANRHTYGDVAVGLAGFAFCLIVLGGYLTYRGTGGFPKGWADDDR